jgi:F-type H+-transporting ATPase subunit epsilon
MKLRILIPTEVLMDEDVNSIVAEGMEGSFCIRLGHIDYVSALVPGLLHFCSSNQEATQYVAVDRGILVKHGPEVLVSVRNAVVSEDIGKLHQLVRDHFLSLDQQERKVRSAMAKLESDFLRRFMELS